MSKDSLAAVLPALTGLADLDPEHLDPWTTFLPLPMHRRALQNDCVVVLGARGTGKTALFTLIQGAPSSDRIRAFFADPRLPDARWFDAFSQTGAVHPEVGALESFAATASDTALRVFWLTHLLRRARTIAPDAVTLPSELDELLALPVAAVETWCPLAERHAGLVTAALDQFDAALREHGWTAVAAYDTLDRLAQFNREIRRRFIGTLMSLWLSLSSRYQHLRGKLFLRNDLFDASELGFPDASKLRPRSVALDWDPESLFRLLARHLARDPDARAWLAETRGLSLHDAGEYGFIPGPMSERVQQALATRLAGSVIGKGILKTSTARWIVSRLQDANGRITPRAFLWFFTFAAGTRVRAAPSRRLLSTDLLVSLRKTSHARVQELCEEYPVVTRLENLRAQTLPLALVEATEYLAHPRAGEPKDLPGDGDLVVDELARLGVLRRVDHHRIDVPDIYRYSFELSPNYNAAWHTFITDADSDALQQLGRELPNIGAILGGMPWDSLPVPVLNDPRQLENALSLLENTTDLIREAKLRLALAINYSSNDPARAVLEATRAADLARTTGQREILAMALCQSTLSALSVNDTSTLNKITTEVQADAELHGLYSALVGFMTRLSHPILALGALQMAIQRIDATRLPHQALAYTALAEIAERSHYIREAIIFAMMAARFVPAAQEYLDQLAARVNLSEPQLLEIRYEAYAQYAKDRGMSVIQGITPPPDPA